MPIPPATTPPVTVHVGQRLLLRLPASEVCAHLRLAEHARPVLVLPDAVQILDPRGLPYTALVSHGEAGSHRDHLGRPMPQPHWTVLRTARPTTFGRNAMPLDHPLVCPECARPAEAGPPAVAGPPAPAAWRHQADLSPLCPTTAVHPSDGEVAVVPATGWYGPIETVTAGAALRAAATYLDRALSGAPAVIALPRPDDLTRLLADLHHTVSRLADTTAGAATRQRQFAAGTDPVTATAARALGDRLAHASAELALAAHTLHGLAADHRRIHHRPAPTSARVEAADAPAAG